MKQQKTTNVDLLAELSVYDKVLKWFFAFPDGSFSVSDIARGITASKAQTSRAIRRLQEEKFLNIKDFGNVWQVTPNKQHPFFITRKVPYNLQLVYESGLVDALLKQWPSARAIVLFGSFRKGDDNETSDLDIAVETLERLDRVQTIHTGNVIFVPRTQPQKVNVFLFNRKTVDANVFASIANGIVMHGLLEVRP